MNEGADAAVLAMAQPVRNLEHDPATQSLDAAPLRRR
jgi:hypothetical protein